MKMSFFMKFDIFNIYFMDEFFPGWVLEHENLWIWCQKTFLNVCPWHFDEFWTLKNSMKFTLVRNFFFQNEIFNFYENNLDVIIWLQNVFWLTETIKSLSKTISATLLWHIFDHPIFFVKFLKNHISHVRTSLNNIFLGWVLMTQWVLPTKSMSSGEYFEYISCGHIFIRSKVITSFSWNYTLFVSYNSMHHLR